MFDELDEYTRLWLKNWAGTLTEEEQELYKSSKEVLTERVQGDLQKYVHKMELLNTQELVNFKTNVAEVLMKFAGEGVPQEASIVLSVEFEAEENDGDPSYLHAEKMFFDPQVVNREVKEYTKPFLTMLGIPMRKWKDLDYVYKVFSNSFYDLEYFVTQFMEKRLDKAIRSGDFIDELLKKQYHDSF